MTAIATLGLVEGAGLMILALAIILVYRSDRIINFAVVQVGVPGAVLFAELSLHLGFVRGMRLLCTPCLPVDPRQAPAWALQVNFWLSAVAAVLLSMLLSYLAYALLLQRLRSASKLVMTVATIALAQFMAGIGAFIPAFFVARDASGNAEITNGFEGVVGLPFAVTIQVGSALFHAGEVAILVAGATLTLLVIILLHGTRLGVAVRATSDNASRASTLGTNVGGVKGLVWLIAGLLSGVAAVLTTATSGISTAQPLSIETTTRILAVALAARFVSIPAAAVAALSLGVLDQGLFHTFKSGTAFEVALVLVIALFLLLQRRRQSRAEAEADLSWLAAREVRPVPMEMREVTPVRNYRFFGGIGGAVLVLGYPFVVPPGQVNLGSVVLVYGIIGLSLLVLTGWAGQISLGQMALAGIGAAVTAVLSSSLGVPFPFPVLGGAIAGGVVALGVGLPALRLRGLSLAISTLALSLATSNLFLNRAIMGSAIPEQLNRPVFLGLDFEDDRVFFLFCLAVLVTVLAAVVSMRRTRTGRALIACRDNELAAQSLGLSLLRTRLPAFGISGFMAGGAGGLLAYAQHGVQPNSYAPEVSVLVFLMVVIGGLGSVGGPLIGALYIGLLLAVPVPLLTFFGTGLGLMLLLVVAPGGLSQVIYDLRDMFLRRVATRYHINVPSLLGDRSVSIGAPAPITEKMRPGGGTAFVPIRYALDEPVPPGGPGS